MGVLAPKYAYGSVAAGRDFWATIVQKVQDVGTSGDFIFQANHFCQLLHLKHGLCMDGTGKKFGKEIFSEISKITYYSCIFAHF